jgi:hypothetical protein
MVLGYDVADRREYHQKLGEQLFSALAAKATHTAPPAHARDWVDVVSFAEIARHALRPSRSGRGLSDSAAIREALALVPGDYPIALSNVLHKIMTAAYENTRPAYRVLGALRFFKDFKEASVISPAEFPQLLQAGEGGMVSTGAFSDSVGEQMRLLRYSRIALLAWETMCNDDTAAFGDLGLAAARRVVDLEDSTFFSVLTAGTSNNGQTMRDGDQLFSASHGNLAASGAAISKTTLSTARAAIMNQVSPGGVKSVAVPRFLVCPPALVTTAEEVLAALALGTDPAWRITVVPAANLSGVAWYVFADPRESPAMVTATLFGGRPGPEVVSENDRRHEAVAFRITTTFAAGACDWRGCYKNPGA